jgi:hypothetical protein
MRSLDLLNFVSLGLTVWPAIIHPARPFAPLDGVAFSFWAALSTLCGLGLRYPLRMFLTKTCVGGVVVDLLVIPWAYVLANYVKKPGDSWRFRRSLILYGPS